MLVQALAHYADTDLKEQLSDQAFEEKPVRFAINIDLEGKYLGIVTREIEVTKTKGKKQRIIEKLKISKSPVARNNINKIYPLLGCDALDYVIGPNEGGWTSKNELEKHKKHFQGFVDLIKEMYEKTNNKYLRACIKFYENSDLLYKARNELKEKQAKSNELAMLSIVPQGQSVPFCLLDDEEIRDYWIKRYNLLRKESNETAGEGFCLISGKFGQISRTHDKIKGAARLGGQPAGVSLMSFDKDAFKSYGWDQNQNSPVNPDRAMAYVLALNDLLIPGLHRQGYSRDMLIRTRTDIAGVGFLYWTKELCDEDIFALAENSQGEDIANLLDAIFKGQKTITQNIKTNDFYLLAVSGNGGRLVVRDWHSDSLEQILTNIKKWFEQLCVPDVFKQGQFSDSPRLYDLIMSILPPKAKYEDKANASKIIRMLRRAIFGFSLDRSILYAALNRLKVSTGSDRLKPERIGLIRMCLNDIITIEKKGVHMSNQIDSNDPNLKHPACICGRLLAIYDGLQYQAQGEVGTPVADRYYALASAYPLLAFPKIELLSKSHLKKLKRDNKFAAVAISRRIDEFTSSLMEHNGKYPSQLSLEDQGRFAIGFHYQKALDAQAREQAKNKKENN